MRSVLSESPSPGILHLKLSHPSESIPHPPVSSGPGCPLLPASRRDVDLPLPPAGTDCFPELNPPVYLPPPAMLFLHPLPHIPALRAKSPPESPSRTVRAPTLPAAVPLLRMHSGSAGSHLPAPHPVFPPDIPQLPELSPKECIKPAFSPFFPCCFTPQSEEFSPIPSMPADRAPDTLSSPPAPPLSHTSVRKSPAMTNPRRARSGTASGS